MMDFRLVGRRKGKAAWLFPILLCWGTRGTYAQSDPVGDSTPTVVFAKLINPRSAGTGIAPDLSGDSLITARTFNLGGVRLAGKLSPEGNLLWNVTQTGPHSFRGNIAVDAQGNAYTTNPQFLVFPRRNYAVAV